MGVSIGSATGSTTVGSRLLVAPFLPAQPLAAGPVASPVFGSSKKLPPPVRFGSADSTVALAGEAAKTILDPKLFSGWAYWAATLEKNPLARLLFTDVTAFNMPKIALARTWKERLDVATLEFSNSAITFFGTMLGPRLLQFAAAGISGIKRKDLFSEIAQEAIPTVAPKIKTARLAVAFGFLFPFAAAFWAAAFLRNWVTLKHNKTANFEAIIGLDKKKKRKTAKRRTLKEEMAYQLSMAAKVFGMGLALGGVSLVGLSLLARNSSKVASSSLGNKLFTWFRLTGKDGNQIEHRLSEFIFWLLPAYVGWMHAARGKNETWEQGIKSANGILWFSLAPAIAEVIAPALLNRFLRKAVSGGKLAEFVPYKKLPKFEDIQKLAEGPLKQLLTTFKTRYEVAILVKKILLLAATPQIINIVLTRRRFHKQQQAQQHKQQQHHPLQPLTQALAPQTSLSSKEPLSSVVSNVSPAPPVTVPTTTWSPAWQTQPTWVWPQQPTIPAFGPIVQTAQPFNLPINPSAFQPFQATPFVLPWQFQPLANAQPMFWPTGAQGVAGV